eukprot:GFUD01083267.1.p1 GENE.GFUD01083267.1~~GFUD01083267.1.p1  ORF type:complete len:176 (-),score=36.46 GFUD01083267.1:19-546(-)
MDPYLVYFDLEATGLDVENDEILQIGAVATSGATFTTFIIPQVPISPGAAAVNKFSLNNGVLSREGTVLSSVTMQQGIEYDYELLMTCMKRYAVQVPTAFNLNMADTLPCLEPYRRIFGNIKLQTLKNALLNGTSQSHGAVDDCNDLMSVVSALAKKSNKTPWSFLNVEGALETF